MDCSLASPRHLSHKWSCEAFSQSTRSLWTSLDPFSFTNVIRPKLEAVARPDSIWWQQCFTMKKMSASHIKYNFGTTITRNVQFPYFKKRQKLYTCDKRSFGVQVNNLKQTCCCFLKRQHNEVEIIEAWNWQRFYGLSHATDVAYESLVVLSSVMLLLPRNKPSDMSACVWSMRHLKQNAVLKLIRKV